jgi:hypothetical protein
MRFPERGEPNATRDRCRTDAKPARSPSGSARLEAGQLQPTAACARDSTYCLGSRATMRAVLTAVGGVHASSEESCASEEADSLVYGGCENVAPAGGWEIAVSTLTPLQAKRCGGAVEGVERRHFTTPTRAEGLNGLRNWIRAESSVRLDRRRIFGRSTLGRSSNVDREERPARQVESCVKRFARERFNSTDSTQLRRASFVLLEVPLAAVRPHLRRAERPPAIVDELIRTTYAAIIDASLMHSACAICRLAISRQCVEDQPTGYRRVR